MGTRTPVLLVAIGCVVGLILLQLLLVDRWVAVQEARDRQAQLRQEVLRLERLVADIDNGFRGYVLMKQAAFLGPMVSAEGAIPRVMERLESLTRDRPDLQTRLQVVQGRIQELLDIKRRMTLELERGEEEAVLAYIRRGEGLALANTIALAFQDLDRRLHAQQRAWEEDRAQYRGWVRWGIPLTAIGGVACGITIGRTTGRPREGIGIQSALAREGIGQRK